MGYTGGMKYLLIRHGKTDANRATRAAFGKAGAPLNDLGIQQATALQQQLVGMGIDLQNETAAISELLRTRETAQYAGLEQLTVNSLLNEVNTLDPIKTMELVQQGILPPEAHDAAKKILENPPTPKIWVTHGLIIAALLVELKQSNQSGLVPDFCEIVEVEI
jgi:hypothetical protein